MKQALLTRTEEAALGRQVQDGLSAATALAECEDPAERRRLEATVCVGRRAEDSFVRRNVGLVYKIAGWYVGRGVDLDDLRQAGFMGLLTAVRRFDPDRGLKLSTMATYWIRQSVRRSIEDTGSAIRLPSYLHQKLDDRPDLRALLKGPISLSAPVGEHDSTLGDFIESDDLPADVQMLRADARAELTALLDELLTADEREAAIRRHDPEQGGLAAGQYHLLNRAVLKLTADDRARRILDDLVA